MEKELLSIMKEMIIFHALDDRELELLADKMEVQGFETGELICREGEMGRELYVILAGEVSVIKTDEHGHTVTIATLREQDSFGEMTLIDVQQRSASVRAESITRVGVLSYRAVLEIYKSDPETFAKLILNIAREISRRLRDMDARLVEYLQRTPDELQARS